MAIFWHHVGDQLSKRDFPRTIGSQRFGLREFKLEDVESDIDEGVGFQLNELKDGYARIGSSTFQIWGVPTGAKTALNKLRTGDWLLLLNSSEDYGFFEYCGRVLLRVPGEQWKLSYKLWGEQKFPIILFLKGTIVYYPWPEFVNDLGYGTGLKGMGRVHSISEKALANSRFGSEYSFMSYVGSKTDQ